MFVYPTRSCAWNDGRTSALEPQYARTFVLAGARRRDAACLGMTGPQSLSESKKSPTASADGEHGLPTSDDDGIYFSQATAQGLDWSLLW